MNQKKKTRGKTKTSEAKAGLAVTQGSVQRQSQHSRHTGNTQRVTLTGRLMRTSCKT